MSISTYTLYSDAAVETALDAVGGEMMGTQDTELLKQIFVAAGQGNSFASITGDPTDNAALALALQGFPVVLSARNIAVLTSNSPADIAAITIPVWMSRWMLWPGQASTATPNRCVMESGSGTLLAGQFGLFTGPNGSGSQLTNTTTVPFPATVGTTTHIAGISAPLVFDGDNIIYIRQTANSANAGTISVYLVLMPFL